MQLPKKHCAFKGCGWCGHEEAELSEHLCASHKKRLDEVASLLPTAYSESARRIAAYHEAIAVAVRRGAPLAAHSIDRRCLYNYSRCLSEEGPESLVLLFVRSPFPVRAFMVPK